MPRVRQRFARLSPCFILMCLLVPPCFVARVVFLMVSLSALFSGAGCNVPMGELRGVGKLFDWQARCLRVDDGKPLAGGNLVYRWD